MKRLLLAAGDRALTRFMAESLLQRSMEAFVPQADDEWDISRAHSAAETMVLVQHGQRFHAIIVDVRLPDETASSLVARIRADGNGRKTPVVMITERGRDPHDRRVATERLRVNGFIERPVTAESLREGLRRLERKRRVLLVEPDEERRERYRSRLEAAGLEVHASPSGQQAVSRSGDLHPDLVAAALEADDSGGIAVCAEIKRQGLAEHVPVVLYGLLSALPRQSDNENAFLADDFIQAPFDDGVLVERILSHVGVGGPVLAGDSSPDDRDPPQISDLDVDTERPARRPEPPTSPRSPGFAGGTTLTTPPPSASPEAVAPTQRTTRRVPCTTSLRMREGDRSVESHTLDISHGGMFFEIPDPPPVDSVVDLTFEIPNTGHTINAVGKVAWVGGTGVGVKFSRIAQEDLQIIVDYVNRVARVLYSPT
ncbi:MAG TPA: response regulator [Myxococcales bacterium LLY-WYZ-16_1]|nr:response regulator [Myxococcales bacterium LLY-WYZ-16_1]